MRVCVCVCITSDDENSDSTVNVYCREELNKMQEGE